FDEHTGVLTLQAKYLPRGCFCKFETKVWYATENKDFFRVITSRCRTLPPPLEDEKQECGFDTLSVDELFKGNMPDWLPDDYATSKLQYYEMKESDVEQGKEWLHLYAELALYTKMQTDPYMFEQSKPFELGKVIVQTRGVVGSMEKVTVDNAVFYVSFKTGCGVVCKGVIRRTRDGMPEHLSEAKCLEGCRNFDEHTGVLTLWAKYLPRGCFCKFETKVWYATENKDFFRVITSRCRTLPPPPEDEKQECGFDTLSVDELFKGNMPDWLPDDYATSKLQYYEMKESDVEQGKEWLHLYAELALYTKMQTDPSKPFELGKVIVQTRGVVGSMEKVTVDNAVFYVRFKTGCGVVCKGVIRRTRDGMPEHLSEAN
ncbi:hypothetical protein F2Q70_00016225, partial [Brassica cretica]